MAFTIKLKNSITQDRLPLVGGAAFGELFINAHSNSAQLQIKATDGTTPEMRAVGGVIVRATEPPTALEGTLWWDTTGTVLKLREGGAWVSMSEPVNLAEGNATPTRVVVTNTAGTDATLNSATDQRAGLMSAADKSKLDAYPTIVPNFSGNLVDLSYVPAADKGTINNSGGDDAELPLVDAVNSNAGLMSPGDKTKLDTAPADIQQAIDNAQSAGQAMTLQAVTDNGSDTTNGATFGGDVGIGTDSPAAKLHTVGSDNEILKLENSGNTFQGIGFYGTGDALKGRIKTSTVNSNVYIEADPSDLSVTSSINFSVDGTERAQITSDGSFGIGGTLPGSPNITLNATGDANLTGNVYSGGNPNAGAANGARLLPQGQIYVSNATANANLWRGYTTGNATWTSEINNDGSASFGAGNIELHTDGSADFSATQIRLQANGIVRSKGFNTDGSVSIDRLISGSDAITVTNGGDPFKFRVKADGNTQIGGDVAGDDPNIELNADGSASFGNGNIALNAAGDATFTGNVTTPEVVLDKTNNYGAYGRVYLNSGGANDFGVQLKHNSNSTVYDAGVFLGGTNVNQAGRIRFYTSRNPGTDDAIHTACFESNGSFTIGGEPATGWNPSIAMNGAGDATFAGTITAANVSDIRFKENITDANPQLDDVVALGSQLKNWDWNDDAPLNDELKAKRFLGLVAQEAEKVCPELTYTVKRTKQGKELTPEQIIPAVIEPEQVIPAVTEERVITPATYSKSGQVKTPAVTEVVEVTPEQVIPEKVVTPEQVIPATYEELDDSYKAINHDILVMKLLGAVAELQAEVAALKGQSK